MQRANLANLSDAESLANQNGLVTANTQHLDSGSRGCFGI